jgi:hypothetical protein
MIYTIAYSKLWVLVNLGKRSIAKQGKVEISEEME